MILLLPKNTLLLPNRKYLEIGTKRTRKPESKPSLFCTKPSNESNTFEGGVLVLAGMEVWVLWLGLSFLSLLGAMF